MKRGRVTNRSVRNQKWGNIYNTKRYNKLVKKKY